MSDKLNKLDEMERQLEDADLGIVMFSAATIARLVRIARAAERLPAYIVGVDHDGAGPDENGRVDTYAWCSPDCVACRLKDLRRALEGARDD